MQPTVSPTLIPSQVPTVIPTFVPTIAPTLAAGATLAPTVTITMVPTFMPSIARTEKSAPPIRFLTVSASRTTAEISVTLVGDGVIYCGMYNAEGTTASSSLPTSVEQIILQNRMASTLNNMTTIALLGLDPMTSYNLLCVTKSSTGSMMSLTDVYLNQKTFSTGCCRTASVKLSSNSITADQSAINFITISVDTLPVGTTSISLDLWQMQNKTTGEFSLSASSLVPSSINMVGSSIFRASLAGLKKGTYGIALNFVGTDALKYSVSFTGNSMPLSSGTESSLTVGIFEVVGSDTPLDPPSLVSAKFSNDGSYVTIRFSSQSDRAGTKSTFICSDLFSFSCSDLSRCQWDGYDSVIAYIASKDTCVQPGQSLALSTSASLRAKCPAADGDCPSHASWAATSNATVISIAPPESPVRPTVVVIAPSRLGSCSNLLIDLTSSTGNGGRSWSSFEIEALKDPLYDTLGSTNRSALQRFFDESYQMFPPTAVPYTYLSSNRVYGFTVTLCNYLGTCSQSTKYVEVASSVVPVVTIPGLALRSTKRSAILSIGAKASVSACGDSTSSIAISYAWTVMRDDTVLSLASSSKDPTKLVLPAYSLQANTLYTVIVSAAADGQSAQSSTQVYVTAGDLIAVVKGGTTSRTVRVGESLSFDASNSYDEDLQGVVGTAAGLTFSWSCTQLQPSLDSSCAAIFDTARFSATSGTPLVDLKVISSAIAGSVAQVELLVTSSGRTASSSIAVTIVSPLSPTLTLAANIKSGRMNAVQNLQFTGVVSLPSSLSGNITWSLDELDADVSLDSVSLSPLSIPVVAKSESDLSFNTMRSLTVYLSIKSNALTVGSSYSFFLACSLGPSSSTITNMQVTVNSPPTPGVFTVSPVEGYELQDSFTFVASRFQDTDLPLMYEYKYYSSSGNLVTIRSLSEAAIGSTILPAGVSSSGYAVVCVGDVYDSMMANTTNYQSVMVKVQPALDQAKMNALLTSSLSNLGTSSSVDDIKQASSVGLYLLNKVNCTLAPDCKALNRYACSRQSHTCGSCYSYTDYYGVEGDSNEACISMKDMILRGAELLAAMTASGKPKTCINDCSGHGECKAYSSTNHAELNSTECFEGALTCYTACECEEDYSSSISCSLSKAEMEQKMQFRESMIVHLASLTSLEDPSDQSVQSLLSSLSEASQAKDELSSSSITSILSTTSSIVEQVATTGLSVSSAGSVTTLLDSVGSGMVLQVEQARRRRRNRRRLAGSSTYTPTPTQHQADSLTGLLKNYSTLLTSNMVPGQQPSDMVGSTYKFSAGVFEAETVSSPHDICNSSMSVTLPSKLSDQLLGVESHAIAVPSCSYDSSDSGSSRSISVISTSANLYDNDRFIGNPLSVEMSSYPCSASAPEGCTIELMIPRNAGAITSLPEESESSSDASQTPQEIICEDGDYSEHFFDCPATPYLSVQCNGTYATVSAVCPTVTAEPSCSVLLSSNSFGNDNCKVVNYTDTTVSCLCSLVGPIAAIQDDDNGRRFLLLSNSSLHSFSSEGTVSVSYVSMLTAVAGSFLTTINTATKLNAALVTKGWQALATLGTLLVFFLSAMTFAHFADNQVKKKVAVETNRGEEQVENDPRRRSLAHRSFSIFGRFSRFASMNGGRESQIRPDIAKIVERHKKSKQQNRYMAMAEEALPKVLISSKSLTRKVIDEMKRHHRWIGVIYYFSKKFPRVLRIVSLATNIIVMLFIQSLTYDLTKGDDGSCESFKTEEECLVPRSQYSSSMSRCYWSYPDPESTVGECHFIQPDNNFTVVIFVAILSALVSTPIALLADWIIQNILSVPTTDKKANTDANTAVVAPLKTLSPDGDTIAIVSNNVVDDDTMRKRKRFSIFPDEQLVSYASLAKQDFADLHRDLKEYRNSLLDDGDRREFDSKFIVVILCRLCMLTLSFYRSVMGT